MGVKNHSPPEEWEWNNVIRVEMGEWKNKNVLTMEEWNLLELKNRNGRMEKMKRNGNKIVKLQEQD